MSGGGGNEYFCGTGEETEAQGPTADSCQSWDVRTGSLAAAAWPPHHCTKASTITELFCKWAS